MALAWYGNFSSPVLQNYINVGAEGGEAGGLAQPWGGNLSCFLLLYFFGMGNGTADLHWPGRRCVLTSPALLCNLLNRQMLLLKSRSQGW